MRALYDLATNEVLLEADGREFAVLAVAARRGEDRLAGDVPPGPRDPEAPLPLPAVAVEGLPDPEAEVTLHVEGPGLVIRGGAGGLDLLAREFTQLAHSEPGARLVAEWFPGHAYLGVGSVPTVFARAAGADV